MIERYYFVIKDEFIPQFGSKYLTCSAAKDQLITYSPEQSKITLHSLVTRSDSVIECHSNQPPVYIKDKEQVYKEIDPHELVLIMMSSVEINP